MAIRHSLCRLENTLKDKNAPIGETYLELELKANKLQKCTELCETDNWIYVLDGRNHDLEVIVKKNKIFLGGEFLLVIDTKKSWANWKYDTVDDEFKNLHFTLDQLEITLKPFDLFNKTEYFSITNGSKPLVFDTTSLKVGTTYIFEGFPNLTAAFLTTDYKNTISMTEKLFLYEGDEQNFTYLGDISKLKRSRQFEKPIAIYVAGQLDITSQSKDDPELLLFMDSSSFSDYVKPRFLQESQKPYKFMKLDASKGKTFLTVIQHTKKQSIFICMGFYPSDDVDVLLVDGYAENGGANASNVIQRLKAKDFSQNLFIILSKTKTLVLLKGTLELTVDYNNRIIYAWDPFKNTSFLVKGEGYPIGMKWRMGYISSNYYNWKAKIEREMKNPSPLSLNITADRFPFTYNSRIIELEKEEHSKTAEGGPETSFEITLHGKGIARLTFHQTEMPTIIPAYEPTVASDGCLRFRFFECFFN